ncbi:hypothetical protein ANCCAN_19447 [Ancylostoma caninum]|uniref:G-protein coupled receptors family 1 profile domain-containing protein n=1 Tax=Ancylostoma caninum TaxID=29170 RepID=A0A368FRB3_ANCCA|nr:hypothetical protein ANCCAN_19447 [Ancylostoma caninum]
MTENADGLRFLIDGVIGNVVASISVLFNVLLFYVFSTSKRLRRQNYANPVLLALFDVITSVCYVLLLPAHVIAYRYSIRPMIEQWIHYVRFVHCVQRIALEQSFSFSTFASAYVIFFWWSLALNDSSPILRKENRYVPVLANYLGSFAAVRYWGRKISTVIVPFFILIYCNYRIVLQLRQKQKQTQQQSIKKRSLRGSVTSSSIRHYYREKRGVRTATKTLVLVVGCYLLSNFVSILLGFWEYMAPSEIIKYYYGYLIVSDIASLLTVFGCLMRLPIYCVSDARIRKAVGRALFRCRVRTIPTEVRQNQLDKWSIVLVSNSLRSNLTGMNNLDWMAGRSKRAKDELAFLLQNRRKILVDMAFRLAMDSRMENCDNSTHEVWLTDIQEEELLPDCRRSRFRSMMANI